MVTKPQAKKAEYDRIRAKPFTRIHGRPTRNGVDRLASEAGDATLETQIPGFDWAEEHGLLAEVVGIQQYLAKTNKTYVLPTEPSVFDSRIRADTADHLVQKYTAQNDQKIESWSVLVGARAAVKENIMDAVDLMYYEQLKDEVLGFKQVHIIDYLDHLKSWCKMNATARKEMKDEYFSGWAQDEHITAFAARLKRGKRELAVNGVTVTDEEICDHYVIQMYSRGVFDKSEMTEYEKKADPQKTWAATQAYFEDVVDEHEEYENNTGGSNKRVKFDSAASVHEADEDLGDDLRRYIESLASEKEANKENVANMQATTDQMLAIHNNYKGQMESKDNQIKEMVAQVKALTESVTVLTTMVTNQQRGGGGGDDNKRVDDGKRRRGNPRPLKEKRRDGPDTRPPWLLRNANMGAYCWTCGYNPTGKGHTSATCKTKAPGHDEAATLSSRRGGSAANKPE